METAVVEMLKRSAAIPSMPQVAARFLEIVQDPGFDYRDVVEVLSADPGAAAEILRLANSSLFGVTRRVSSLPQALVLLGLRRVRSLVLGRYIVDSIDRKRRTRVDMRYFWRRSLTCGVLAGELARGLGSEGQEEAFISGLLADVGVIILDEAMSADYAELAEGYAPGGHRDLARREAALLGIDHGQVSALVMEHWQLPETVCEAVALHPWELQAPHASPLARVIGAADLISLELCGSNPALGRLAQVCREVMSGLHMDAGGITEALLAAEPRVQEFAEMLRIPVQPGGDYQRVLSELPALLADEPAVV